MCYQGSIHDKKPQVGAAKKKNMVVHLCKSRLRIVSSLY